MVSLPVTSIIAYLKIFCYGAFLACDELKGRNTWNQGETLSHLEAMRGTFEPSYLFYSLGIWELLKLRKDYKKQEGANFSLQKFHNLVLDHGMPPIILLREHLLQDKNSWKLIL